MNFKLYFIALYTIIGLLIPIGVLGLLDEVIAIIAILHIIVHRKIIDSYEKKILISIIALVVVGILGNYTHKYQLNIIPIVFDILACTKFFFIFLLGHHYTLNLSDRSKKKTIIAVNRLLIPFVLIACICGIINFFVDIGMTYETRMGFRTFRFIFSDSGHIGFCWYIVLLFLTANYMLNPILKNLLIILAGLIVWTLTFKSRAILFVLLYVILFYQIIIRGKKIKFNILSVGILIAFSLYVTADQLNRYFLDNNENMPRTILLNGGISTMLRFIPIGSGFATYGTDMAVKYYSKLYYELGYDKMWGLTPEEPFYAHDCYWPAIMGEMGIIGVLIEVFILVLIYKIIHKDYNRNKYFVFYSLFAFITQTFASLPTSVFFQAGTCFLFLLLPLMSIDIKKTGKIRNDQ